MIASVLFRCLPVKKTDPNQYSNIRSVVLYLKPGWYLQQEIPEEPKILE